MKDTSIQIKKTSINEALCCCEYYNIQGERSHILALLCDCEIIDSICDRILKRENISEEKLVILRETIEDRCRFPWFTGAVKINIACLAPIILLPMSILLASQGPVCTIFSFILLPALLILINRFFNKGKRSKVFLVLAIISILFTTSVFLQSILHKLYLSELILFLTIFSICVKNISNLMLSNPENHSSSKIQSNGILNESDRIDLNLCKACNKFHKTERSGFCVICNKCIPFRDHHCVWIDKCIGEANHKLFVYCLGTCIVTSLYGLYLTFSRICAPTIYKEWFLVPNICKFVYSNYESSIVFVTAIYASIFTLFLIIIFIHQIILISQNLTMHEWSRLRRGNVVSCSLFVNKQFNPYDLGFYRNWKLFLTRDTISEDLFKMDV